MTTPPEMGAGTEKRHSGRPAENNRPYAAERVSHTVASRETVLTVSNQIGISRRLHFRDTLKPVEETNERIDVMNEVKSKNLFIRVSEKRKISSSATLKSAVFPYRNISVSVLWDICRGRFCPKCSSLSVTSWTLSVSPARAESQRTRKKK